LTARRREPQHEFSPDATREARPVIRSLLTAATILAAPVAFASDAALTVFKSPDCGCCGAWAKAMETGGFAVRIVERGWSELDALKARLGIAPEHAGCHTAEIDGYVVEGHVPAADIRRLLDERPEAIGIAAPGMPVGSPGMEMGGQTEPYDVVLVTEPGNAVLFERHD
jgi:hypothetical protein